MHPVLVTVLVIVVGFVFLFDQNNRIVHTKVIIRSAKIPTSFDDYKILQISDLHNKNFGKNQAILLKRIKSINPDIIVITGDLIDRRRFDLKPVEDLLKGLKDTPVYFVPGNHEAWSSRYAELKTLLNSEGVFVLENEASIITRNEQFIDLYGLKDPGFYVNKDIKVIHRDEINANLSLWKPQSFSILLSHRPEYFDLYARHKIDLSLSGHAHGGQIRIPFVGAVIAPNQGFFPKYSSGHYHNGTSSLFVSRGLGNSSFPFRIFNQPELVLLTLKANH